MKQSTTRCCFRVALLLLLAIVGHEALMPSAHAATPSAAAVSAKHGHHTAKPLPAKVPDFGPLMTSGQSENHCAPGHVFVRRLDESPSTTVHPDVAGIAVPLPSDREQTIATTWRLPGRSPAVRRALLQVFLN